LQRVLRRRTRVEKIGLPALESLESVIRCRSANAVRLRPTSSSYGSLVYASQALGIRFSLALVHQRNAKIKGARLELDWLNTLEFYTTRKKPANTCSANP